MDKEQLIGVVEALIFVSGDPVMMRRLVEVLEVPEEEIKAALDALAERYLQTGAGIQLMEVAGGYQLRTRPIHSSYVNQYLERKRKSTLSGAGLETLAIIAYKQPISRVEVEAIRGVGVDGVLKSLLDKRLVKVVGVKEAPGRPNLYGTTKQFLEYFGINSLDDLPPVENLSDTFPVSAETREEEEAPATETASPEASSSPQPNGAT